MQGVCAHIKFIYFDYAYIHTHHAQNSQQILQHEWPDKFQAALDTLVDASSKKVLMGHGAVQLPTFATPINVKQLMKGQVVFR